MTDTDKNMKSRLGLDTGMDDDLPTLTGLAAMAVVFLTAFGLAAVLPWVDLAFFERLLDPVREVLNGPLGSLLLVAVIFGGIAIQIVVHRMRR